MSTHTENIKRPSILTLIRRGWTKKCPHCGVGSLFVKGIDLFAVLGEFGDVLSEEPGRTNVVKADIRLLPETPVISQRPYRLPDRLKEPVKN